MVEQVDTTDLKSAGLSREGSSPSSCTKGEFMAAYRITLRRLVAEVTKLSFDDNLSQKALKTAEELYESNLKYAKQHTWRRLLHAKHLNEAEMCKYFTQHITSMKPITQLIVIDERSL